MTPSRTALCRLAVAIALACTPLAAQDARRPAADALKLTAKAVPDKVGFDAPVRIEFTFANVGDKPLSISMRQASRCGLEFSCSWGGGGAEDFRLADGAKFADDEWRRLQAGESFTLLLQHDSIASKDTGKIKLTVVFHGDYDVNRPPDAWDGMRRAGPVTVEVEDDVLLRELRLPNPNTVKLRTLLVPLLQAAATEPGAHASGRMQYLVGKAGPNLVAPLAEIAADRTLEPLVRGRTAEFLGIAVYYSPDARKAELLRIALPAFDELLSDGSPDVRMYALYGFSSVDREQPHLGKAGDLLSDPDERVRMAAAYYVMRFPDRREVWPYVVQALKDESPSVRKSVIESWGYQKASTAERVEFLMMCLAAARDEDALKLLKELDRSVSAKDVPKLSELFDAKGAAVQAEIVRLAGLTTGADLAGLLKKALAGGAAEARSAAMDVIEKSGRQDLADLLRPMAQADPGGEGARARNILIAVNAPPPLPDIRKLMAAALPPKEPPPALEQVLDDYGQYRNRKQAAAWLFLMDDPTDVDTFRPLLDSPDATLRAAACKYLGRIRCEVAFPQIVARTQDPSALVRRYAAEALGDLGDAKALPDLERLAKDGEFYGFIQQAALKAKEKIGQAGAKEPGRAPGNAYCGCTLQLAIDGVTPLGEPVRFRGLLEEDTDVTPLTVPVTDEGQEGCWQYVLFKDGREVERGEPALDATMRGIGRYDFGESFTHRPRGLSATFRPKAGAGDYELRVEARFLCTEQAGLDFVERVFASGVHRTAAETFTLVSNRVPLRIDAPRPAAPALADDELDRLAKILAGPKDHWNEVRGAGESLAQQAALPAQGDRAVEAVLKYCDPAKANAYQLWFLVQAATPRTMKAFEAALFAGNDSALGLTTHLPEKVSPELAALLVRTATAEVGATGWDWDHSRRALQALDGRLGPGDGQFVPALCEELSSRLQRRRDAQRMRGGESVAGSWRTAFLLGRIGDKRAVGVLRRAADTRDLHVKWYAEAALKLVDLQNRTARERAEGARTWLRHCYASPEEHFMARARLIPVLNAMLGAELKPFYAELEKSVTDPWMQYDIRSGEGAMAGNSP